LEKGFNALEGVFMIGEGKNEIGGRLNALEGVQLHWKRVNVIGGWFLMHRKGAKCMGRGFSCIGRSPNA